MARGNVIVIDAETIAAVDPAVVAAVEEEARSRRPAQNTLKKKKTLWDTQQGIDERVREALAKTAVDPLLAEPICVCMEVDGEAFGVVAERLKPLDLVGVHDVLEEVAQQDTWWVGHNVTGFDFGVLQTAWVREGICPPTWFPRYRNGLWSGRIWDTMTRAPGKTPYISLDDACAAYRVAGKGYEFEGRVLSGADVAGLWARGLHNVILAYCQADVETERNLFLAQSCGGELVDGPWDVVAEQVREIEASALDDTAMKLSVYNVLNKAGMVPR